MTEINCSNCAPPLKSITASEPVLRLLVTLKDHDWALSVIKGISQRSSN